MAAIVMLGLTGIQSARAELDNQGKEFLMLFLPNISEPAIEVHLTSEVATQVTVEYPVNSPTFSTTVNVGPGAVTIVSIPIDASQAWIENLIQNTCVRASSNNTFVAYMINRSPFTSDAALALPTNVLNNEYIVMTYSSLFEGDAEFGVVASYDNTTVTITPSKSLISGEPGGVPFTVVLDRGQGYINKAAFTGADGDLTGTVITADKPIGVSNGNACATVPLGSIACDHVLEVAQPVQTWGKKILAMNLPSRTDGSVYKVVASEDNTAVTRNGVTVATLDRGETYETDIIPGAQVFEGTKPIFVVQFMTGAGNSGTNNQGDPAMGNMIPFEQYTDHYTFSTVGGGQFAQNYLTIIAKSSDVGTSMTLDGALVPAGQFTAIGASGFSTAVILVESGTHTTSSANPHGITVEGLNEFDSYVFPGGALFEFINGNGDGNAPVVTLTVTGTGTTATGTATDGRGSEDVNGNGILDPGEDLNGNNVIDIDRGIYSVELGPGSTNLELTVDPFVPGASSVSYSLAITPGESSGHGSVVVTDGSGNTSGVSVNLAGNRPPVADAGPDQNVAATSTSGASVTFNGTNSSDPDGHTLTYEWKNSAGTVLSTSAQFTTTLPIGSHTLTLTVNDGHGLSSTDQVTVNVADNVAPVPTVSSLPTISREGRVTVTTIPTATDNTGVTIQGTTTDPLLYTVPGTYTIRWKYTDASGNTAYQNQTIIVRRDVTRPTITVTLSDDSCWPPNHRMVEVMANITVSDNADPNPRVILKSITSNEGENCTGDGNTSNDIQHARIGTDDRTVSLRCERRGNRRGRIYTLTYQVTDAAGNKRTATATFSVDHDQSGGYGGGNGWCKTVFEGESEGLMEDMMLYRNYPNPFAEQTTLSFELAQPGNVTLSVIGVDGRTVAVPVVDYLQAGKHSVVWDGRDANGAEVPEGVYFYRLQSDGCNCDRIQEMVLRR